VSKIYFIVNKNIVEGCEKKTLANIMKNNVIKFHKKTKIQQYLIKKATE